jgi:hypothetical protein
MCAGLDDRISSSCSSTTPSRSCADKIRYYDEPFFKARTGDYFHGVPAANTSSAQRPLTCLGGPQIDWKGVRAVVAGS